MATCSECKTHIPFAYKFCGNCGAKVVKPKIPALEIRPFETIGKEEFVRLHEMAKEHMRCVIEDERSKDFKHYVYEEVMGVMFGGTKEKVKGFWDAYNAATTNRDD